MTEDPILRDHAQHAAQVDAWLERSGADLEGEAFLRLIEAGLATLWDRTRTTLGEVTLVAIAERVLHDVGERFPSFSALMVEAEGFQCRELRERLATVRPSELREGGRFLIVQLLTVLGTLTAEILSPELHARLAKVVVAAPVAAARTGRSSAASVDSEDLSS